MRDKGRTRGIFKVYLQWPLFLSVLLIVLTAVVAAVSIKAGIIVSVFTIVYIGIALWLYFSRKRGILAGLIAFSSAYDQSRQNLLEDADALCGNRRLRTSVVDEPGIYGNPGRRQEFI